MSASNTYSRYAKVAPKTFCKVCHDAGKSEKEYTSHFVKSDPGPNGKVVCPTLLAQDCRFCFKKGHTSGYCPTIAANKKAEEKSQRLAAKREVEAVVKPNVAKKSANVFAAFDESSDVEPDEKVTTKPIAKHIASSAPKVVQNEDFPALPSNAKKIVAYVPKITGYASVAAKTPQEYETERYEQQLIANSMKRQMPPVKTQITRQCEPQDCSYDSDDSWAEAAAAVAPRPIMKASLMDWAATYESDDEDW